MGRSRSYLRVFIVLVAAIGLTMLAVQVMPSEATSSSSMLFFSSPPKPGGGGGNDDPPPATSRGELDDPSGGGEVTDPQGPIGYSTLFPPGAVLEAVKVKIVTTGVPAGVPPLPGADPNNPHQTLVGQPFLFAAWSKTGDGSLARFEHAVTIVAPYDDSSVGTTAEQQIRLFMYNPAIQAWVKVGGTVDPFQNTVSGIFRRLTPFTEGPLAGQTLFCAAIDVSPVPEQTLGADGTTQFSFNPRLYVLPGTVESGTHFEFGQLQDVPDTDFQLTTIPFSLGAYFIDRSWDVSAPDREVTQLAKPLIIEWDVIDDRGLRSGGLNGLTMIATSPLDGSWIDLGDAGYVVIRQGKMIKAEVDFTGVFALALK